MIRVLTEDTGRAVVVYGEPGIGKTTLVEQMCVRAAAEGWRVDRVLGVQAEESYALGGLNQLALDLRGFLPGCATGYPQVTGSRRRPDPSKSTSTPNSAASIISRIPGNRGINWERTDFSSSLASGAPRPYRLPYPKDTGEITGLSTRLPDAFDEHHRREIHERRPVLLVVILQRLGGPRRRMPPHLGKAGSLKSLFVGGDAEVVVLDRKRAVLEMEGPLDRRAFLPLPGGGGLESVGAVRRCRGEVQGRVGVDRDEPSPRLERPGPGLRRDAIAIHSAATLWVVPVRRLAGVGARSSLYSGLAAMSGGSSASTVGLTPPSGMGPQ